MTRKLNISITQDPKDTKRQVILFDPPVASWAFAEGHVIDELWQELTQASHHLLFTNAEEDFDENMQHRLKGRILGVLLNWTAQKWLIIPAEVAAP